MNRIYFFAIVVLALNCLALSNSQKDRDIALLETELNILRSENMILQLDSEMLFGAGYVPGTLCQNLLYKTDEGSVFRIGDCN